MPAGAIGRAAQKGSQPRSRPSGSDAVASELPEGPAATAAGAAAPIRCTRSASHEPADAEPRDETVVERDVKEPPVAEHPVPERQRRRPGVEPEVQPAPP